MGDGAGIMEEIESVRRKIEGEESMKSGNRRREWERVGEHSLHGYFLPAEGRI